MSNILISTESRFPVDRKILRQTVEDFLVGQKIKTTVEVSISIVGDRKMKDLNFKYRQHENTTPVLSFSFSDVGPSSTNDEKASLTKSFVTPPDNILRLGDIVISYPQAVLAAAEENKMVDQVLSEFTVHGLRNLLGLN